MVLVLFYTGRFFSHRVQPFGNRQNPGEDLCLVDKNCPVQVLVRHATCIVGDAECARYIGQKIHIMPRWNACRAVISQHIWVM